jgi:hypothetical protein
MRRIRAIKGASRDNYIFSHPENEIPRNETHKTNFYIWRAFPTSILKGSKSGWSLEAGIMFGGEVLRQVALSRLVSRKWKFACLARHILNAKCGWACSSRYSDKAVKPAQNLGSFYVSCGTRQPTRLPIKTTRSPKYCSRRNGMPRRGLSHQRAKSRRRRSPEVLRKYQMPLLCTTAPFVQS